MYVQENVATCMYLDNNYILMNLSKCTQMVLHDTNTLHIALFTSPSFPFYIWSCIIVYQPKNPLKLVYNSKNYRLDGQLQRHRK